MGAGTMTPDSRAGGILGAAILPLALSQALTRRREEREKRGEKTDRRRARGRGRGPHSSGFRSPRHPDPVQLQGRERETSRLASGGEDNAAQQGEGGEGGSPA